jgi:hypothetical protein
VVVGREGRALVEPAREQAGRQRDAGDDPDPRLGGRGQHLVQRLAAEDVEDDLHGGHVRAGDRGQRLGGRLDRDAVGAHPALGDHLVQGVEDLVAVVDLGRRAVQLHQVEGVVAEQLARAVVPPAQVVRGVLVGDVRRGPSAGLGGHHEPVASVVVDEPADQPLGPAVAVDVGGVQEGDARVGGRREHL